MLGGLWRRDAVEHDVSRPIKSEVVVRGFTPDPAPILGLDPGIPAGDYSTTFDEKANTFRFRRGV